MTGAALPRRTPELRWVLAGGLVAGALDIGFACVFWWATADVSPVRIFQSVAAGLLGDASFRGGTGTAVLGLALHFLIAVCMAAAYAAAAWRWPALVRRPWLYGILYGLLLYVIMNHVVVPLSAASPGPRAPLWVGLSVAVHGLLVGLAIALAARRAVMSDPCVDSGPSRST